MRLLPLTFICLGACEAGAFIDDAADDTAVDDVADGDTGTPIEEPEPIDPMTLPVLLVHGINGHADNYDIIVGWMIEDGWSPDQIYAYTFDDPSWGCNVDNADAIAGWVDDILAETGAPRVNLVAHSMGVLSSRYYLKHLGGGEQVNTYATLGGMHHGLSSSCSPDFPFKPCVWDEICSSGEYVADLNEAPATPGPMHWISIYGTADTIVPNDSSQLDGAEMVEMPGIEHYGPGGLNEDPGTFEELARVLKYDVVE